MNAFDSVYPGFVPAHLLQVEMLNKINTFFAAVDNIILVLIYKIGFQKRYLLNADIFSRWLIELSFKTDNLNNIMGFRCCRFLLTLNFLSREHFG